MIKDNLVENQLSTEPSINKSQGRLNAIYHDLIVPSFKLGGRILRTDDGFKRPILCFCKKLCKSIRFRPLSSLIKSILSS